MSKLISVVMCVGASATLLAQEANVLGLPAIPQPKQGASGANAGKPQTPLTTPNNRELLAGELGIQHSALDGIGRLKLTTRATFATAGAQSLAIAAARDVQRELPKACGKQCRPEKMALPRILPNGQLEFEIAFSPLHQHLTQPQFIALLQSRPLNLTANQLKRPELTQPTAATEKVTN